MQTITPSFSNNNIPIVFSCDNNYAPYLSVAIQSIIENATANNNYDIFVLDEDFNQNTKNKILSQIKGKTNINITFVAIKPYLESVDTSVLFTSRHLTLSTYFRFFIPRIFSNFNKVLYLDADLVAVHDVAELYNTNLHNNVLGAVVDIGMVSYFKNNIINKLQIPNVNLYAQAGVLLFNIPSALQNNFEQTCLQKLVELKNPKFHDQDTISAVYYNNICWLDNTWNFTWDLQFSRSKSSREKNMSTEHYKQYYNAFNNVKIIHYCGQFKPWTYPNLPLSNYFWQYAKNTAYYEEILFNNMYSLVNYFVNNYNKINKQNYAKINNFYNFYLATKLLPKKYRLTKYKFITAITFGKTKQKYKQKYNDFKEKIDNLQI